MLALVVAAAAVPHDMSTVAAFTFDAPIAALDAHPTLPLVAVGDKTGRVHALTVENCENW